MTHDDDLISRIRQRASNPSTRIDVRRAPLSVLRSPATPEMIASTEAELGFELDPFLRRNYVEIADGGFGPGHGLLSLASIATESRPRSLSSVYRDLRTGGWPRVLLPLWDWGDAIWSCLDVSSSEGAIVTHDDSGVPMDTGYVLRSWLGAWAEGVNMWKEIYQDKDATLTNPFTKKPMITKVRDVAKGKPWVHGGGK